MRALRSDIPVSRAANLNAFVRWLDHEGVPYARELERARLPRRPLPSLTVIPVYSLLDFTESVARREGVEDLGVHAALHAESPGTASSARTLRLAASANGLALLPELCALMGRYSSHVPAWVREAPSEVWFCMRGTTTPGTPGARQAEQYRVASVVAALRGILGGSWQPRVVHLECAEPVPARLAEFLGASLIRTGMDHEAVSLPRALLERPLTRLRSHGGARTHPEDAGVVLANLDDWTARLAAVLVPGAGFGSGTLSYAAEVLGMGARTLQRRLRSVGLTCSELLERACVLEAQRLLRDPHIPIREVAHRVGHRSPSSFTRAYRRHLGCTPSAFRRGTMDCAVRDNLRHG